MGPPRPYRRPAHKDNERPVLEACAEAWAAAVAEQRPVDLMVVKLPMARSLKRGDLRNASIKWLGVCVHGGVRDV